MTHPTDARAEIRCAIGFDTYRGDRSRLSWGKVAILAALTGIAVAACAELARAEVLYVNACDADQCRTQAIEVTSCTAAGQAAMAEWAADHPALTVRAWKCIAGEPA